MGAVYDALLEFSPYRDGELLEAYRVYEFALEGILTPKQLAIYAKYIRHSKTVRVFDEMTSDQIAALPPEQIPIASAVLENEYSLMENRRVAALIVTTLLDFALKRSIWKGTSPGNTTPTHGR